MLVVNGKDSPIIRHKTIKSSKLGMKTTKKGPERPPDVTEYIEALKTSRQFGDQVVCHHEKDARGTLTGRPAAAWPAPIENLLTAMAIPELFSHQARAIDFIRKGRHVVMATPTASGKSLVYILPIVERVLSNANSRTLYLSPLKALAQDQYRAFEAVAGHLTDGQLTAGIYDGDTTAWFRKKIRNNPPHILLTNPEMIHLALLPYHQQWQTLFENLDFVVIDEVHTYRGLLGSHLAQVFRRLQRICRFYGSQPIYICCSATVANPVELVHQLTGMDAEPVTRSGAPRGQRHVVMLNPHDGPVQATIQLLKAALQRGLRTIVYTQSRKLTELLAMWVGERSGEFREKISAYRAGLLPEERRDIERKLATGDLLAVITTSALELGIDIGDLDLCILVGYPGSIVATWQRGGRVGRGGQPSALVVVAGEDALDQYFMRNPDVFLSKGPEAAVVNPDNPDILVRHLACAAAEFPLEVTEPYFENKAVKKGVTRLLDEAQLLQSADGERIYATRKMPHREVDLRGGGSRYTIVDRHTGQHRGEIDGLRVFRETHPGAIYLHRGETLLVYELDLAERLVRVAPARVDYYTKVRTTKDTEIIEVVETNQMGRLQVAYGILRITEQVTGYEKWQIRGRRKMNIVPLDLPPHVFETQGMWFDVPLEIQDDVEKAHLHFMGGIHAVEHAAIGILPLLVMADRNDLGGISTPYHPQVERAAIFIYDGIAGGAGLSQQAYRQIDQLFTRTREAVAGCPCESGCPACVHSPKCGSGNRPIDKTAAHFILQRIQRLSDVKVGANGRSAVIKEARGGSKEANTTLPAAIELEGASTDRLSGKKRLRMLRRRKRRKRYARAAKQIEKKRRQDSVDEQVTPTEADQSDIRFGVFDIETQLSAQEVGGWHRADLMRVSCVVLYDSKDDIFHEFLEDQIEDLITHLQALDLVIGFNIKRFDYRVLSGYTDIDFGSLPTLDLLEAIQVRLGFRLSLDHLAKETLGTPKSADGLQALRWWREGKIREIVDYCKKDVEITRDLYLYGRNHRYLVFRNKAGQTVRVPVSW